MNTQVLNIDHLVKHYVIKKPFQAPTTIQAINDISFSLGDNETLGVVGESGCGKSTLAKVLMRIEPITSGNVQLNGKDLGTYAQADLARQMQMVFQDPYSSLNPRKKVWDLISEPLRIREKTSSEEARSCAIEMMKKVGLRADSADRYPHMFSGGQRQRIGIARALILKPKILICDEPVSALDVSIQAQILNLLIDLKQETQMSMIFISHDLSVVKYISDRILVMYSGKIVEQGDKTQVFERPTHPYTQTLQASTPKLRNA